MSTPRSSGAEAESSRAGWWIAVGLVVVIVIVVLLGQAYQRRSPSGPDIVASRDQLNKVLVDTFALLHLEPEVTEGRGPVACDRPGGGVGEAYTLDKLQGPAVEDVEAQLTLVRQMWEGVGLQVSARRIDPVRELSAMSPDGGGIYLVSGPGGTTVDGQSACGVAADRDAG